MNLITKYKNKKVLVLGLGKSGYETALLLSKLGAKVTVNDGKDIAVTNEAKYLEELGIHIIGGGHPEELLDSHEMIFKNPGIPYDIPFLQLAAEKNIPVMTEVELAYEINEGGIIAITGTNGKTTVTSLIGDMFSHSQKEGLICGNIGFVASKIAQAANQTDTLIMELSSFQLMGIQSFKPHIALITNVYSAHLDYHHTQKHYEQAKFNITSNQSEDDFLIFNEKQKRLISEYQIKSQVIYFSTENKTNGAYISNGKIYFKEEYILDAEEVVLPGSHNQENVLAAICAAKLSGLSNAAIITTLTTFEGIKHRLQYIGKINDISYYNDSKATNILAATFALDSFESPIHYLCGGLDRGNDFDELIPHLSHVKRMYIFGETTEKFKKLAEHQKIPYTVCENVKDAVKRTAAYAESGEIILLSPACASWDQYPTFEVRGDEFIETVKSLEDVSE